MGLGWKGEVFFSAETLVADEMRKDGGAHAKRGCMWSCCVEIVSVWRAEDCSDFRALGGQPKSASPCILPASSGRMGSIQGSHANTRMQERRSDSLGPWMQRSGANDYLRLMDESLSDNVRERGG